MGVSKNSGTPQIIHFNGVFHYKPSILGYHYCWKPPYINVRLELHQQDCWDCDLPTAHWSVTNSRTFLVAGYIESFPGSWKVPIGNIYIYIHICWFFVGDSSPIFGSAWSPNDILHPFIQTSTKELPGIPNLCKTNIAMEKPPFFLINT